MNHLVIAIAVLLLGQILSGCGIQDIPPDHPSSGSETFEIAFRDCADCPEMVIVPKGEFMMGAPVGEAGYNAWSEGTQRKVTIGRAFAVGRYEVTVDQFRRFVQATGYDARRTCLGKKTIAQRTDQIFSDWRWDSPDVAPSGSVPVACVNWEDARAYTGWLSQVTGQRYRLLTEAEWEYAARAGSTTRQHWSDDPRDPIACAYENGGGIETWSRLPGTTAPACSDAFESAAPVGSFRPNPFGLHDMLGNVAEWVQDCWRPGYKGAPADGSAAESGDCRDRVRRGGAWSGVTQDLRSARRDHMDPRYRWSVVGFRIARDL